MLQLEQTTKLKRIGVLLIFVSFPYGLAAQLDNEASIPDDMSSLETFERPSDLLLENAPIPQSEMEISKTLETLRATYPILASPLFRNGPVTVLFSFEKVAEHTYPAPSHVATCPRGYTNVGLTCFKGVKTYSKCCTVAWSKCPCRPHWTNMGCHCHQDAHSISNIRDGACKAPYFQSKITARCHENCRAGYTNTGEYCTQIGLTCLKLTLVVGGKPWGEGGLPRSCCACAKEIDGHLKHKIHQASMDEMEKFIEEMRKLIITMNIDNWKLLTRQSRRQHMEVFEKAVKDVSKACAQARKSVLYCVQKRCKRAGKKGEQALEETLDERKVNAHQNDMNIDSNANATETRDEAAGSTSAVGSGLLHDLLLDEDAEDAWGGGSAC